ncbi:phosphoglycerate kinase [Wolbachia endosymbiont of Ctenocephalides felis wCfeT]|uniref:phosphoglycerate kinase n=1 Tax=Wolbachia endosymbiont of Ctenocephalides felis wCfeT TaxID=2732593 RepID=UPI001583FB3F|nr:phosphoglycerate kinase [Wolbachia endosymbiont of Ctenocephalides felis wCfeT]
MRILDIKSCNLNDKIVLLRVDFNVPIKAGEIRDSTRILRALPTIKYLVSTNAKILIISHFGRPKAKDDGLSLQHIVKTLSQLLNKEVKFIDDCIGAKVQETADAMSPGDIILLENLRFYKEEEQNDLNFAKQLASLADVYVNDAFSCSHRAHASISRITELLPSYAGFCLQDELKYLEKAVSFDAKPITAIVGGAKILTKIKMLVKLAEKVDYLILGGAIANNFLLFDKINIGKSFFQDGVDNFLHEIVKVASKNSCKIIVPEDVLVAVNSDYSASILRETGSILDDDVILDIGPQTLHTVSNIIKNSKTVLWNGPIGVFEHSAFANGTIEVMKIVSNLTSEGKLTSIIGGGDSLSAINAANLTDEDFTYVSTGGGAFLSWLSGDEMPGIAALQN